MEKMREGPDVRLLADVHALISALLFLTCFFQQFSPGLIFLPKSFENAIVQKPSKKVRVFNDGKY